MISALVLAGGFAVSSFKSGVLTLFSKSPRPLDARYASVDGSKFVLLQGRIYRLEGENQHPVIFSRWPHVSKIASFRGALAALTYAGRLNVWARDEKGRWVESTVVDENGSGDHGFVGFAANEATLIAADREGRVYAAPKVDGHLTNALPLEGIGQKITEVSGYAGRAGFALTAVDQSRVFLDGTGHPCAGLLEAK